ncbi:hypothetical protein JW835_06035 [bacterium]|nr:hypothetical protein [bacterium]
MKTPDILSALTPVIEVFEQLSIPHYIGGSVASSIYGMARATIDVDIVADIKKHHVSKLKEKLDEKYYIDEDMILGAINNFSSFNLIHFETAIKIDVFIYKDEPHQRKAIERKVKDKFDEELDFEYYFSSPEDIIIAKLRWFEQGNRVSERQWLDILGVIKVQGENLDIQYLRVWSQKLGLLNLLEKAFNEGGIQFKD